MSTTPNLGLAYLASNQAQKEVTHNEALNDLDLLVQASVIDRDLNVPPVSPVNGDQYIVGPSPSGAWTGWAGRLVAWYDGWISKVPAEGWRVYIQDEDILCFWSGSGWQQLGARFLSSDSGASAAPVLELIRDSASPAAADALGRLSFQGRDAAATLADYAMVQAEIVDPAVVTRTGRLVVQTMVAGMATTQLTIDNNQVRIPAGTVGAPALSFSNDSNTGMLSPAADTLVLATNGLERLRIDGSGFIGIGQPAPINSVDMMATGASPLILRMQAEDSNAFVNLRNFSATTNAQIQLTRGRGTIAAVSATQQGDVAGQVIFSAFDASATPTARQIANFRAEVASVPGTNDIGGRLVFTTRGSGVGATNVERLRIGADGTINLGAAPNSDSARVIAVASAVNRIELSGAAVGGTPSVAANGSDVNIDLRLNAKGTGVVQLGYAVTTATAPASFSAERRLAIKDASGTTFFIPLMTTTW